MKLAYLSISKIPSREANSIHVMKMCQAFAQLGHEVMLLAPDVRDGIESGVGNPFHFYGVEPCFELRKLPWRRLKGRGWIYGFEAARHARKLGVDAAFGRSLHACAAATRFGLPTIWDAHMLWFLAHPGERWLFKRMIRAPAFRHVTTNCGSLAQCILEQVPELEGRILAAHNGADSLPDDLAGKNRPQVGYVGHLYAGKGFEIIPALAALVPDADFHVVGGEQNTVDALRADPTFPRNIRFHGFVPPQAVDRLCLAFDVTLAPYQREVSIAGGGETGAWMSPLKVFGYMAAAKAIICSDLPVLREVIEHERNGLLVAPNDPEAWAASLRRLLGDFSLRERLARTAHADFLSRHTWRQRASKVLEGPRDIRGAYLKNAGAKSSIAEAAA
jgi:glycosyltransferase involved in cell wall biosynthesis